jgi:hypothetical protein
MARYNGNSAQRECNDQALSRRLSVAYTKEQSENIAKDYLRGVASQTRGSFRMKRANMLGLALVQILKLMPGTQAEQSIAGYIDRARLRLKAALDDPDELGIDECQLIATLLLERVAFDNLLKLDQMESTDAINRVGRCRRCQSWFWGRVANQRYCSASCRVRHYQASPEGKRYKREWARTDYVRTKRRDERVRQLAQAAISRTGRNASNL